MLEQLLDNAAIAERDAVPLCQDTGTVWVRIELGVEECLCGDVQSEIDAAVALAYRDAKLRMSVVRNALFDRTNTGTNTPAFVEVVHAARPGAGATVHLMLKGGGSDNASRVVMLPPGAGVEGVRRVVLETVEAGATGACPPLLIGVGVGSTFDKVAGLAKRALLRPIGAAPVGPERRRAGGRASRGGQRHRHRPRGSRRRHDGACRARAHRAVPHRRAAGRGQHGVLGDTLGDVRGGRVSEIREGNELGGIIEEATPASTGAYRRILKNQQFRRLWYAQFVSGIGDWLVIGFLMPLVTTLSGGSSFAVAGILIAKIIPALFFSSLTGVLVDRFDRRKVMITADLVRAALALVLVATNSLWVIYLVVVLMETASLFFWPARNALIPYLVAEEDITAANGLAYTTQQASMLIGLTAATAILAGFEAGVRALIAANVPIVGNFVGLFAPALLGPRAGVILDVFTFLFSAAMVCTIQVAARPPELAEGENAFDLSLIGKDVVESFRFLGAHKELRGLLVTIGLAVLGGGAIIPVGFSYVQDNLIGALPFADRVQILQELTATPATFMLVFMALGMVVGRAAWCLGSNTS